MKAHFPILVLLSLLILAVIDIRASVLTVTKTADTSDGICDADCSLREAVTAAASGDTVVFSTLFESPQTITLTLGQITIDKNLTITGTGQNLITISGNLGGRIFNITGGVNVTMSGMKLRDGNVGTNSSNDAVGGAIRMIGGNLLLADMEFTNNTALYPPFNEGDGGAIAATNLTASNLNVHHNISPGAAVAAGSVDMVNSVVSDNDFGIATGNTLNISTLTVTRNSFLGVNGAHLTINTSTITGNGRGIAGGDAVSTMSVENSIISDNTDAGLSNNGVATVQDTLISNNQYTDSGAGITNGGTLHIIDSIIMNNSARLHGGGIKTDNNHLFLTNSTVSGNFANGLSNQGFGGGIYIAGPNGRLTATNSTFSNNRSKGEGGGIRRDSTRPVIIRNTIIAENTSTLTNEEDASGVLTSQGTNLIGNTFGSSGWIASDLLNVNPLLGPLAENGGSTMTHALLPGSPAINAGNNAVAIDPRTQLPLTTDQRGFVRFFGGTVDIGAYEVQPLITGTITYGNATWAPTPRYVSGVLLTAIGSPNLSATSRVDGTYTLGGFGSAGYTVTPSKVGGANGISSFDAGLVAKHVAGIQVLTGNQFVSADVSGNGTLSSFDAGQIARYTVGIAGFGSSGSWLFIPTNRTYSSVNGDISGEDFIALLMGDVSGNWVPP